MEKTFPSALPFRHPALAHHRPRQGEGRELRLAAEILLNMEEPVVLSAGRWYPHERLIEEACLDTGILSPVSGGGKGWEMSGELQGDHPMVQLLRALIKSVTVSDGGKRAFQPGSLLAEYSRPPYGLTPGMQIVLVALALRRFHASVEMFSNFKEVLVSGRTEALRRHDFTFDAVSALVRNPADWVIVNTEATDAQREYLEELMRIFAPGRALEMESGVWEQAFEAARLWFDGLPPLVLKAREFAATPTGAFLALMLTSERQEARRFFTTDVPASQGFDMRSFSLEAYGKPLLERITRAVEELEGYFNAVSDRILAGAAQIFGCEEPHLEQGVKAWLLGLPAKAVELGEGDGALLLKVTRSSTPILKALLEDLPAGFGFGIVDSWDRDWSGGFLAKLAAARREVELGPFLRLQPIFPDDPDRRARALELVRVMAGELELPGEEMEQLITELLEQIAWA